MKNNCNLDKPRIQGLRVLCLGIAAVWLVATLGLYKEGKREKYDDRVKPGAVIYGTHSAPVLPTVSVSTRQSSIPMISGNEVRSYAHSGHAATSSMNAGGDFRLYTTSSATARTGGGGGGIAGGGSSSSSTSSSFAGTSYSGGFAAISTLSSAFGQSTGMANPVVTASELAAVSSRMNIGPRRVIDNGDGTYTGEYHGEYNDATGLYWDEDEEDWVAYRPVGTTKEEGGFVYEWNGSAWVLKGQVEDLGTPIGSTPWLLLLLLLLVYILMRKAGFADNKE